MNPPRILCESLTLAELGDRQDAPEFELCLKFTQVNYYAKRRCFDCRRLGNVRKNSRPAWWEDEWKNP